MINKINLFKPVFDNDLDAFVPEYWANESVAILIENMVIANMIHRDFSNEVAQQGDVVNTRKPGTFTAKRKGVNDDVTVQDAEATNIKVPLDQHFHVSFVIKDGQQSKSFKDLVAEYLSPALIAIAQGIDKVLLGQIVHFIGTSAGGLSEIDEDDAVDVLVDLRKQMNINKAPMGGRNLILGPTLEAIMLKNETFHEADRVGDDGTALREASLGRKLGFNIFMCQNASEFTNGDTNTATATAAAAAIGATTIYVDDVSGIAAGDMVTIGGDMTPQRVTAVSDTSGTGGDTITITPGLRDAVAVDAVVTIYDSVTVGLAEHTVADSDVTEYPVGYDNKIYLDGFTANKGPQTGQMIVADPAGTAKEYTIIDVEYTAGNTYCYVTLDRPLEGELEDNDVVSMYPSGNYGFAFNRNCMTFVSRPLELPRQALGVDSAVASVDGLGVRVCMSYEGRSQGTLVTVDLLCGVKVLDEDLGAVLLG